MLIIAVKLDNLQWKCDFYEHIEFDFKSKYGIIIAAIYV